MPNRKIKHIVAKLVGASTEETLDVYDVDAVHTTDIVNNLTSTDASKVLSAAQGKALSDSRALTGITKGELSYYTDGTLNNTYILWYLANGYKFQLALRSNGQIQYQQSDGTTWTNLSTGYLMEGPFSLNVDLANGNTMTKTAGMAYGYYLFGTTRWIVFFTIAVTCTTNRNQGTGVFSFSTPSDKGHKLLSIDEPYAYPCLVNGDGTMRFCARAGTGSELNSRFDVPVATWNLNTEFRISGAGLFNEIKAL